MVPAPQAVVKGDGSLMWGEVALHHATVADLLRAREQGFFKGDPLALVFDRRPFGNGTLFSWDQLADVLSNFGLVAGAYLALRSVIQIAVNDVKRLWLLGSQLRRRVVKRREARWLHSFIRRHQRRWVDKGADSPLAVLTTVLARRVWKRQTLARYLGVEEGECDRLLNVLGYEASSARGVYRRSGDRKKSALSEELVASIFEGFDPLL